MSALTNAAPGPSLAPAFTLHPLLSTGTGGTDAAFAAEPAEPPTPF